MASTYTVNHDSVMGDMRVQFATLTLTDGPTEVIATGMNYLWGTTANDIDPTIIQAGVSLNDTADGSFMLDSGVSGAVYSCIVFGR